MSNRQTSVEALMLRAENELKAITEEYESSLSAQNVSDDLRIDIKDLCGKLRSVLDYLAHDVRDNHCPTAKPKDRFYFPISPDRNQFEGQTEKWFPGLRTNNPDLYDYLESVQPYNSGFKWLSLLNRLNNENKHQDLVEQTRIQSERVTVSGPGSGSVSWNPSGVTFGSGVSIGGVPVDPRTQMPVPHPSQKIERVTWVDFRFAGIDVSAIGLLRESVAGANSIAEGVYKRL